MPITGLFTKPDPQIYIARLFVVVLLMAAFSAAVLTFSNSPAFAKRNITADVSIKKALVNARTRFGISKKYYTALEKFYRARRYKKAWIMEKGLSQTGKTVVERLRLAKEDGLNQRDFPLPELSGNKPASIDDIMVSFSLIRYGEQVQAGRISPDKVVEEFDLETNRPDFVALLKSVVKSADPVAVIDQLPPPHSQYQQLKSLLKATRETPKSEGTNQLALENQIIANMERWRWMPRDLGDKYVWVNLPTFSTQIKEGGKTTFTTKSIIGKADHPTPLISSRIKNIVLNPFWNIPSSIVGDEILPKLKAEGVSYLDSRDIKVLKRRGRVLDPEKIDWSKVNNPRSYRFRQSPGDKNALGRLKVLLPNSYAIFLHDTNEPELFDRDNRAISYGCIRLAEPVEFANTIASFDKKLQTRMPGTLLGAREYWLKYSAKLPVYMAYFTVVIDSDGQLVSYPDIYGYDQKTTAIFAKTDSNS